MRLTGANLATLTGKNFSRKLDLSDHLFKSQKINAFVKDSSGLYLWSNETNSLLATGRSDKIVGLTDFEAVWHVHAEQYRANDRQAFLSQELVISTGKYTFEGEDLQYLSIKNQCRLDSSGKMGIFGIACVLEDVPRFIANPLYRHLLTAGKFDYAEPDYIRTAKFSPRESECLYFLLRGWTANQIAKKLEISPKTVETYVSNLKVKIGVDSRQELISAALELGYYSAIPKTL